MLKAFWSVSENPIQHSTTFSLHKAGWLIPIPFWELISFSPRPKTGNSIYASTVLRQCGIGKWHACCLGFGWSLVVISFRVVSCMQMENHINLLNRYCGIGYNAQNNFITAKAYHSNHHPNVIHMTNRANENWHTICVLKSSVWHSIFMSKKPTKELDEKKEKWNRFCIARANDVKK